jgi:serine/threonine-protein kinase RsbW
MVAMPARPVSPRASSNLPTTDRLWRTLAEFSLPSTPGSERQAMERVALIARTAGIKPAALERLKTAVAEATLNAMEHGNHYRAELPVRLAVRRSTATLRVDICDQGAGDIQPAGDPPGLQSPRGWGMFLIQRMVDEMKVTTGSDGHTVQLIMYLSYGSQDTSTPRKI